MCEWESERVVHVMIVEEAAALALPSSTSGVLHVHAVWMWICVCTIAYVASVHIASRDRDSDAGIVKRCIAVLGMCCVGTCILSGETVNGRESVFMC